jgi:hypothetical protein
MSLITLEELPNSSAREVIDSLLSDTFNGLPASDLERPSLQSGCELSLYDGYADDHIITQELRNHYAKCAIALSASTGYSELESHVEEGVNVSIKQLPTNSDADNVLWAAWTEGWLKDYHYVITANPSGNTDYWKSGFNAHSDVFNVVRPNVTRLIKKLAMLQVGPKIYDIDNRSGFNAAVDANTSSGEDAQNVELDCWVKTVKNTSHITTAAVANGTVDWVQVLADLESVSDGTQHLYTMYENINTLQQSVDDFGAWRTAGGHGAYAIRFGLDMLVTEAATMTQYEYSGAKAILGVLQTIDMINTVTTAVGESLTGLMQDRLRYIKVNGL